MSSTSDLSQKLIKNVNEVSKYFVDLVGGAGIPVSHFFFIFLNFTLSLKCITPNFRKNTLFKFV